MRTHALLVPALATALAGCALNQPAERAGAAASPITEAAVRAHMSFLASDALNGRASGSRDEWIAASYLAAQMQTWGLEPLGDAGGFVQEIGIERPETSSPPTLSADGKTFTHGTDMRVQFLSAARVAGPLQKFVEGTSVKPGAVVLMPQSFAPPTGRGGGSGAAAAQTAAAAVVLTLENPDLPRPPAGARLPSPPARLVGVTAAPAARPATIALSKAAYGAIAAFAEGTEIALTADVKTAAPSKTWNAVGRLPGSDPAAAKEVILLSAHLDHVGTRPAAGASGDAIFNGADDDASGTIAVLELARALSAGPRPKRTIVFAFFGSEESGGYGSRFFADKPVVPLTEVVANLQFEMIGRPDNKVPPHTLWLTGYERSTLGPALAKQGAKLVQDPHPEQSFFTRSDNIQFARRGVVAHTVSSFGLHKDYHQPSDEMKTIDFPHMTDAIRSMLEPIRWLANSGFKPDWLPGMKP
ncbi:MAG TPA: M20/M25/M40 family metallo-hydrolase [Vicinamibacterales bacterium]|nr:M20/M25/M40 family metallo-hydrolase [Vicinamibacterales bacterium]